MSSPSPTRSTAAANFFFKISLSRAFFSSWSRLLVWLSFIWPKSLGFLFFSGNSNSCRLSSSNCRLSIFLASLMLFFLTLSISYLYFAFFSNTFIYCSFNFSSYSCISAFFCSYSTSAPLVLLISVFIDSSLLTLSSPSINFLAASTFSSFVSNFFLSVFGSSIPCPVKSESNWFWLESCLPVELPREYDSPDAYVYNGYALIYCEI